MKQIPLEFYKNQKTYFEAQLNKVQKELKLLSLIRFIAFVTTVFFLYYFIGKADSMLLSVVLGTTVFSFFLRRYWKKKEEKERLLSLVKINRLEIEVLEGNISNLTTGAEFKDPRHAYSFDIDLFGKGSFFQYLNRTVTRAGTKKLVSLLGSNDIHKIDKKQEALLELARLPKWRQEFSALADSVQAEVAPEQIITWIKQHKKSLSNHHKWVPLAFSLVTVLLILGISFFELSFNFLTIWFFIGLGFSGLYMKKVGDLYAGSGTAKATFQQYYKLIALLEEQNFTSSLLKEKHAEIRMETKKSSQLMKQFFGYLNSMDQRNNIIFAIFGNGLLLWDIKQAYRVENWILANKEHVENWFELISFFDAQNSLANYVFNHPDYSFPAIVSKGAVIDAVNLGHPILAEDKRVSSDCLINQSDFFIVTGANMAGKSTFLRTVSLSIIMSNIGLPVCASQMKYKPIQLITSIRNTDSLSEDTSYFFSELKRLKFIIEALKEDDYFIVLDEILKGTNSVDKAEGSQKFVEKLIAAQATGIIATHDLSLCEIESTYKEIQNYFFEAEIKNDELYFDYKLKQGICQNMNASFLLRKMEIV